MFSSMCAVCPSIHRYEACASVILRTSAHGHTAGVDARTHLRSEAGARTHIHKETVPWQGPEPRLEQAGNESWPWTVLTCDLEQVT